MAEGGLVYEEIEQQRIGPFVTGRRLRRADGTEVEFSAWRHRKGYGLSDPAARDTVRGTEWWAPRRRGWWIALLFMIGSACFFLGAFPATATLLGAAVGPIFFIGSIFFTSAAYLQYFEATNEGDDLEGRGRTRRWFGVRSLSIGWWAAAIQFIGTLNFNLSTLAALGDLSTRQEEKLVWAPDMIGSACFLVASALVIMETHRRFGGVATTRLGPAIAWLNMIGSVAFGFAAVAAFVLPSTGELLNVDVVNAGTYIGAICFFIGALLLIPDMEPEPGPAASPAA